MLYVIADFKNIHETDAENTQTQGNNFLVTVLSDVRLEPYTYTFTLTMQSLYDSIIIDMFICLFNVYSIISCIKIFLVIYFILLDQDKNKRKEGIIKFV